MPGPPELGPWAVEALMPASGGTRKATVRPWCRAMWTADVLPGYATACSADGRRMRLMRDEMRASGGNEVRTLAAPGRARGLRYFGGDMGGRGVVWVAVAWVAMGAVRGGVAGGGESFRLRIVHTNDMHARFEEVSQTSGTCSEHEAVQGLCYGGFARVGAALAQELERGRKENVSVLSLNAGDTYQGTVWYTVYKWKVVSHFLKMLPIDAMALGNHEFDDGIEGLTPFLNDVGIPVLAANIDFSGEPEMVKAPINRSLIFDRGGRKIGVIGYLTPDTVVLANPGKLQFKDEVDSLREEAKRLKAMGVDIIIGLGHSGYEVDLRIAAEVEDMDVVVGGHSHTFLYTGPPPDLERAADLYPVMVRQKNGRKVAMVQAYAFTKYLGILDLVFDERGELVEAKGNPILLNHEVVGDPEVLEEVNKWRSNLNATLKQIIGETKVVLDASLCRFYECNIGNLITDAYLQHGVETHSGPYWAKAAIAIQQAGGIRASINSTAANGKEFYARKILCRQHPDDGHAHGMWHKKGLSMFSLMTKSNSAVASGGTVRIEDVITAMPFFSPLSLVRVSGTHLMEALEWSVARYDPKHQWGRGEFLQVSGLKVTFDLSRPPGSRVASVKARCQHCQVPEFQPLKSDADYDIIMPTFLLNGGDNFTMFKDHAREIEKFDLSDTEVAIKYIRNGRLLYPGLEDRLEIGQYLKNPSAAVKSSLLNILIVALVIYF